MGLERIIVFGAITVGVNRTFALAKVTCPQGRCSIEKLMEPSCGSRVEATKLRRCFRAPASAPDRPATLKVKIPRSACKRLKQPKSGIVSVFSVSVANENGGESQVKVFARSRPG